MCSEKRSSWPIPTVSLRKRRRKARMSRARGLGKKKRIVREPRSCRSKNLNFLKLTVKPAGVTPAGGGLRLECHDQSRTDRFVSEQGGVAQAEGRGSRQSGFRRYRRRAEKR